MRAQTIEIYEVETTKPKHGEIVHVIGYISNCVYYDEKDYRNGFWFVDGTGDRCSSPKEWYRLL